MDTEAQFAALELRNVDIPCYISNSNAHTLLPVGQGGIGLHVRQGDLPAAMAALQAVGMWDEGDALRDDKGARRKVSPWHIAVWVLLFLAFLIKYLFFSGQYY
jgi:hypothetical protein